MRVMFIDYGNSEEKSLSGGLMLPEKLLVTVPYAAKLELDIAVKEDVEEKILVEGVVIKLANDNGKIVTKLIVDEGLRVCPIPGDRMEDEKCLASKIDENAWALQGNLISTLISV